MLIPKGPPEQATNRLILENYGEAEPIQYFSYGLPNVSPAQRDPLVDIWFVSAEDGQDTLVQNAGSVLITQVFHLPTERTIKPRVASVELTSRNGQVYRFFSECEPVINENMVEFVDAMTGFVITAYNMSLEVRQLRERRNVLIASTNPAFNGLEQALSGALMDFQYVRDTESLLHAIQHQESDWIPLMVIDMSIKRDVDSILYPAILMRDQLRQVLAVGDDMELTALLEREGCHTTELPVDQISGLILYYAQIRFHLNLIFGEDDPTALDQTLREMQDADMTYSFALEALDNIMTL